MKHYIFLLGKHHLYYTLDFEESLKIEDLPEANTNKQSKLTQGPPLDTRVSALGS
jgi:hypothetical protein